MSLFACLFVCCLFVSGCSEASKKASLFEKNETNIFNRVDESFDLRSYGRITEKGKMHILSIETVRNVAGDIDYHFGLGYFDASIQNKNKGERTARVYFLTRLAEYLKEEDSAMMFAMLGVVEKKGKRYVEVKADWGFTVFTENEESVSKEAEGIKGLEEKRDKYISRI